MLGNESWTASCESGTWRALVPRIITFLVPVVVPVQLSLVVSERCCQLMMVQATRCFLPYVASKPSLCCLAGSSCALGRFQLKTTLCVSSSSRLRAFLKAWTSRLVWGRGCLLCMEQRTGQRPSLLRRSVSHTEELSPITLWAWSPEAPLAVKRLEVSLSSAPAAFSSRWLNGSLAWQARGCVTAPRHHTCSKAVLQVTVQGAGAGGWEAAGRALQLSGLYLVRG